MATVYGYYVVTRNSKQVAKLCFICAVERASCPAGIDEPLCRPEIHFETDSYETPQCTSCGHFIQDSVTI